MPSIGRACTGSIRISADSGEPSIFISPSAIYTRRNGRALAMVLDFFFSRMKDIHAGRGDHRDAQTAPSDPEIGRI